MTTSNPAVMLAIKSVQTTNTPAVTPVQFSPEGRQEDPWHVAIRTINVQVAKFDLQFNTESVKSKKRPSFIDLLAYAFPNMTIAELEATIQSKGGVNPNIAIDPERYLKTRGQIETLLKLFNDARLPKEPEAQLQTLSDFIAAKQHQAKILGHEIRNPFFTPERYEEMYPIVYGRIAPAARTAAAKDFGEAPETAPKDQQPNDSYALYRMFDSSELRAVSAGQDISPACQAGGQCYTAVGMDLMGGLTISEAYNHLVARGNMRDRTERQDLARLISEPIFEKPEMQKIERYGKDRIKHAPANREQDASLDSIVLPMIRASQNQSEPADRKVAALLR